MFILVFCVGCLLIRMNIRISCSLGLFRLTYRHLLYGPLLAFVSRPEHDLVVASYGSCVLMVKDNHSRLVVTHTLESAAAYCERLDFCVCLVLAYAYLVYIPFARSQRALGCIARHAELAEPSDLLLGLCAESHTMSDVSKEVVQSLAKLQERDASDARN